MDWETAVRFLAEVSIALMEPELDRALERVGEVAAGQDWLSYLCLRGQGTGTSDVLVRVGEEGPAVGPSAAGDAARRKQGTIELTGTREGVPVSLVACLNVCPGGDQTRKGGKGGELVVKEAMSEVLRLFARRLSVHYAAARVRERELADAVGALSHDFRTPLACIKGYLTLLAGGKHLPGSPEWDEYLGTVMEECERLERLVSVVLESALGPKTSLSMEPVLLPPLIKRILLEESAISRGHRFFTDISEGAREVYADPTRLEQVLRNLLDNAIKYSPEGSLIVLRVKRTKGGFLFSVADQGGGIAPEHLNRLFERHYRVESGDARKVKGTGLGLLIARQIVNAHGGDIWAESVVGKGSTFYFTIPFHKESPSGREVAE
ncbi:MAG: sensor histidine kinase [Bacillota bacterium]|nr:cell wall metabolism sensor histidine kinase WalK [Candidatus Fermentithermobacillaceae bacterium]